ncbi:MAG: cob(I)yrinic acid a,c-diamide adenosyltransferase [Actinomycetota bacterium]|nr:cob(I)yrinic acid a,c-diamide adenosyltransferase [Actinomycetota bacterium]
MKIYTRRGDDGTTGLLYGGRVPKSHPAVELNGTVDEAQAALGLARADAPIGGELDTVIGSLENDLWVLMAEVATAPANRRKLVEGETMVSSAMVERVETLIDSFEGRYSMPASFVIPGQNRQSALLDQARTVVRRAERRAWEVEGPLDLVAKYLNRLSDLCWVLARWQEDGHRLPEKPGRPRQASQDGPSGSDAVHSAGSGPAGTVRGEPGSPC